MHLNNIGSLRFIGAFLVLFRHRYTLAGVRDPISHGIRGHSSFELGLPGLGVALFFALLFCIAQKRVFSAGIPIWGIAVYQSRVSEIYQTRLLYCAGAVRDELQNRRL